jgi:hypothetical protein
MHIPPFRRQESTRYSTCSTYPYRVSADLSTTCSHTSHPETHGSWVVTSTGRYTLRDMTLWISCLLPLGLCGIVRRCASCHLDGRKASGTPHAAFILWDVCSTLSPCGQLPVTGSRVATRAPPSAGQVFHTLAICDMATEWVFHRLDGEKPYRYATWPKYPSWVSAPLLHHVITGPHIGTLEPWTRVGTPPRLEQVFAVTETLWNSTEVRIPPFRRQEGLRYSTCYFHATSHPTHHLHIAAG